MNSKFFGIVLLIVGTTIGAGMLALPVATAQAGFWGSTALLVSCWALMTACGFLFLEVNLWLPPNSNMISMAGATLGKWGQGVAWLFYLVLLYSILAAYVSGGGDLFHYVLTSWGIPVPPAFASILFTVLFGVIVYFGIRLVDYVNRCLMFGKLGSFFLLALLIAPFVTIQNLNGGYFHEVVSPNSISITAVAFTCLMIIPSLRTYFGNDVASLRKAIFLGTLIPLLCYIAWDAVIMGVVPLDGTPGLKEILKSPNSNSDLLSAISSLLHSDAITMLAKFFTSICMATSFLSVSLSLSDFLSDGLSVEKQGTGNILIYAITFIPPVAVVLFWPDAFIGGLRFAGISVCILMILFPPLMAWRGRYHCQLANGGYTVKGGKSLLTLLLICSALMIAFAIFTF